MYPGALPVTPLTTLVTDSSLTNTVYQYAIQKLNYSKHMQLMSVYQTALPQTSGVLYDLRLSSDVNEEYFALIESV